MKALVFLKRPHASNYVSEKVNFDAVIYKQGLDVIGKQVHSLRLPRLITILGFQLPALLHNV